MSDTKQRSILASTVDEISREIRAREVLSDDGILDIERYESAQVRILWMLKQEVAGYGLEDVNKGERIGRDWHAYYPRAIMRDAESGKLKTSKTWGVMSVVSHMLVNDVDFARSSCAESHELATSLLSTAIVEADKEPGDRKTPTKILLDGFAKYKEIVARQLVTYDPDIIIVGVPEAARDIVLHCQKVLGGGSDFSEWTWHQGWYGGYIELRGKLLFWTVHPSTPKNAERYCREILQAWHMVGR